MKRFPALAAVTVLGLLGIGLFSNGGERGPGKYSGVVTFDRWDGCTLYSGTYVMYVSEKVKHGLRPYAGQAVQIDAKEVSQPQNPGDGLIGKFTYLGPAPEPRTRNWVKVHGLRLSSSVRAGADGKAIASIVLENGDTEPTRILSGEWALTLLRKCESSRHSAEPFDGPSYALITRQNFEIGGSEPRWQGSGLVEKGGKYSWTIDKENALPHDFWLAANTKKTIEVKLDLPDGQYDFLSGYGGGVHQDKCVASNLSGFDIKDGKAIPVNRATK